MIGSPPFCKNCKHIRLAGWDYPDWRCAAPANMGSISPVSGAPRYLYLRAEDARETESACGNTGYWFVKKEYYEMVPAKLVKGKLTAITAEDL